MPFLISGTAVTWTEPVVSDNSGSFETSQTVTSGSFFASGIDTVVTYTFRDAAGNEAVCVFTVRVIQQSEWLFMSLYPFCPIGNFRKLCTTPRLSPQADLSQLHHTLLERAQMPTLVDCALYPAWAPMPILGNCALYPAWALMLTLNDCAPHLAWVNMATLVNCALHVPRFSPKANLSQLCTTPCLSPNVDLSGLCTTPYLSPNVDLSSLCTTLLEPQWWL